MCERCSLPFRFFLQYWIINKIVESEQLRDLSGSKLEYNINLDCPNQQTSEQGSATIRGSPWRDKISLAILELQEKGEIQMLYDKWWKNPGDTCTRNEKRKRI
ncbi:glutamate receptor ionotropic, kainate glr-3-like [Lycorma delicatula]|uniref:glutamate receptor ionotropic, kainate glr-3-like n=1 Tax=Lycorma delicatula TaxID=130591 RepID=UPI003F5100F4